MTSSLNRFMYIKIKHTKRFYFFDLSIIISNKKISFPYFQKSKCFIPISFNKYLIVGVEEFHTQCDHLRQFLGTCGCFPHFINDLIEVVRGRLKIVLRLKVSPGLVCKLINSSSCYYFLSLRIYISTNI